MRDLTFWKHVPRQSARDPVGSARANDSEGDGWRRPLDGQVAVAVGQLFSFRSNEIVGTTLSGPPAPTNVAATALSTSRIRVTWDAVPRATSYRVYQSINGGAFAFKGTTTTTSFTAAGLAAATLHSYYVVTVDDGNLISPNSATVSATTL